MGLFNIFKKKEIIGYNISEEEKNHVETICNDYLKDVAEEYDKNLKGEEGTLNKPSFNSKENFYDWNKEGFVINFFSINQEDYFKNKNVFERIGNELKEKINPIINIDEVRYADDSPIIFFTIVNKNEEIR